MASQSLSETSKRGGQKRKNPLPLESATAAGAAAAHHVDKKASASVLSSPIPPPPPLEACTAGDSQDVQPQPIPAAKPLLPKVAVSISTAAPGGSLEPDQATVATAMTAVTAAAETKKRIQTKPAVMATGLIPEPDQDEDEHDHDHGSAAYDGVADPSDDPMAGAASAAAGGRVGGGGGGATYQSKSIIGVSPTNPLCLCGQPSLEKEVTSVEKANVGAHYYTCPNINGGPGAPPCKFFEWKTVVYLSDTFCNCPAGADGKRLGARVIKGTKGWDDGRTMLVCRHERKDPKNCKFFVYADRKDVKLVCACPEKYPVRESRPKVGAFEGRPYYGCGRPVMTPEQKEALSDLQHKWDEDHPDASYDQKEQDRPKHYCSYHLWRDIYCRRVMCKCFDGKGVFVVERAVSREGKNKGRQFRICRRKGEPDSCNLFVWLSCECGVPPKEERSMEAGPQRGKLRWVCGNKGVSSATRTCNWAQWAPDSADIHGNALHTNRAVERQSAIPSSSSSSSSSSSASSSRGFSRR